VTARLYPRVPDHADDPGAPGTRPAARRVAWSRDALAVGGLCLALAALVDLVIRHEHGITGDEPFYEAMARHPGGPHNFPYAYRVVVPWVVHVLPFSQLVSFTVIGLLAIGVAGAAMYELLRDFQVPSRLTAGLVVGFALSPTLSVVIVRHFRSIDPASILVMVLGCLFVVRRQRMALWATLVIGTGVRESTVFLIPFAYAVWAQRPIDRAALRDVALTCIVPLAVYVLLRTSIDAVGKQYIPGYSGPFITARLDFIKSAFQGNTPTLELRRLAVAYGPVWLIAPLALRDSSFARRGLVLVALCVASMTYAYDWGRIIFLAAPVFFVATGVALTGRRRLAIATVVALLAVDVGYGVYLQAYGVTHGLDETAQHIPVY
jgi:hypothetical protein